MTSEIEYQCNNCGHEGYNTRAVPDVPELVRYYAVSGGNMMKHDNGLFVLYSQAAEIIAAKDKEIEQAKKEVNTLLVSYVREHFFENKTFQPLDDLIGQISQLDNAITITRDFKNRAEAAEAELAEYEAQEPVAWRHPEAGWTDVSKDEVAVHCKHGTQPQPLYDSPAPAADLKTENERLREVLRKAHASLEIDRTGRFEEFKNIINHALDGDYNA